MRTVPGRIQVQLQHFGHQYRHPDPGPYQPSLERERGIRCRMISSSLKDTHAQMPWILLLNGVPGWWSSLSMLHSRTPRTGAILDDRIMALLVGRHVWLESGAGKFCSRWHLENVHWNEHLKTQRAKFVYHVTALWNE